MGCLLDMLSLIYQKVSPMLLKSNATATNAGELTIVEMLPWKNQLNFAAQLLTRSGLQNGNKT